MLSHEIERLLAEQEINALADNPLVKATKEFYADLRGARFLECQVVLKGGHAMAGVLTALPKGSLLMVSIAQTPDKRVMLVESYFGDDQLQCISMGRPMPEQLVKPANPTRNGSPIILG
jgi:hypothetical protein